tara:strand:- start:281 stop:1174 length:894 start_codon:yes stop_codon:yes gene_type:complete
MTISSSNIGFSTIASEKAISTSNLSLASLSGGQLKLPMANDQGASSQYGTFTQTWTYGGANGSRSSSTVASAQGQGVTGLNQASYAMSEWAGFDPGSDTTATTGTAILTTQTVNDTGCFVISGCVNDIYCQKSGNTITFYVTKTTTSSGGAFFSGTPVGYNGAASGTTLSGTTAIGTITLGTNQSVPTACSMSYTTTLSSGGGGFFGSGGNVSTVSGGSTATSNLGSTKIGYRIRSGGLSEGGPGTSGTARFQNTVKFNFTGMSSGNSSFPLMTTATIGIKINQSSFASHGSGFQSC